MPTSSSAPAATPACSWAGSSTWSNALACIGTAVLLFPVARRQNEAAALGFVATRLLEATTIVVGVVSLFSIVTLRQDLAGGVGCSPERGTPLTSGSRTHAWTSRVLTSVGKASGWARAQARSAM
jgi:hypothetical protein